ncbi:peroxiredoxin [Rhizobium sp. L1K21]|uniref:peroxiredoxin n=1 Tax=Rhizobium sp. L1K21 TaxID=2954933 RepID=UPI0020934FDB|nr:peroxiredoxin [Rhizobium sp. L1K21]MCO6186826.1 peroxiredoxin [Rhizobium sp. L1K21]
MTIAPGEKIPSLTIMESTSDGPAKISTEDFFAGKKVVLFGLPGAFTPTCSMNHVPGYVENRDALLAKGVDDIAVVSVNDHFVMGAWAKSTNAVGKIRFLCDWDAEFVKALGLERDLSAGGLGVRSTRFSMLVEDGTVKFVNVEDNPGQATVSSAAAMLEAL